MNEYQQRLLERLLEVNQHLPVQLAQTWIELLWDDFETTYAKAGKDYKGKEMTAKIVEQWVENHGPKLHEFIAKNPKYKHLLKQNDNHLN
ncbi:WVELL protein [Cytobacillus horneckiae]|uniref:WVELL protein n=1 Tax=Cytobacillus horneckiae TaxID=549687 RepID=A0A2N0ZGK3_9BACI|nr:YfhJ family protein [Cytobacillus horneckiae]NRG48195.1 hypothetical protein [Bacillus sp. CRN 9]MBN6888291.1 YfhJ family protein [Cytobacillus horneckiae]MCM3177146.1 YfhJ family protein [Cytobacillus horneckiae]MEC1154845.1 YfhJ family protein [Cytobacillus horneckiae]MED2940339.1 YfhJ family protein [Cytobacillus horneckiae]